MNFLTRFLPILAATPFCFSLGVSLSETQGGERIPKVDFVVGEGFTAMSEAFRSELARLGYREGTTVDLRIVQGISNSDGYGKYLEELGKRNVDVVVVAALPYATALKKALPNQRMVVVTGPGLVQNGLADSMEKPGGAVTGIDELPPGLTAKRLNLLHLAAPGAKKIALLSTTPGQTGHDIQLADASARAKELGLTVKVYRATSPAELTSALEAIGKDGMQGMVSFQGGLALMSRKQIVEFAAKHRIPAIYQATLFAEAGGLMAWAPDLMDQCRTSAQSVVRILKGEKPGDIPITHPKAYFLTINRKAADRIGLKLRQALLDQAHRVIH